MRQIEKMCAKQNICLCVFDLKWMNEWMLSTVKMSSGKRVFEHEIKFAAGDTVQRVKRIIKQF